VGGKFTGGFLNPAIRAWRSLEVDFGWAVVADDAPRIAGDFAAVLNSTSLPV
jgi:hypothetical protein